MLATPPALSTYSTVILALIGITFSCSEKPQPSQTQETAPDPFAHISDSQVNNLLQQAMEQMGGVQNWQELNAVHFTKAFSLYTETGETEMATLQKHAYTFKPDFHILIGWQAEEIAHEIRYDGKRIKKYLNGEEDTEASQSSLETTLYSSTFVAGLPYNMLDPGAELTYLGADTLDTGQAVEVLQARYNPEAHDNHTTPDTWHLYFHADTYTLVGYTVQHADHYSYVLNLKDTVVQGFTFPVLRESYRVDSTGKRLYLRADYTYSNYRVEE